MAAKALTWEEYNRPRYDLVIKAIENEEFVDGDVWESFCSCDDLNIIEVNFGNVSQDNIDRGELDRYIVFELNGKYYLVWYYVSMKTLDRYYPTQIAYEVKRTKKEIDDWDFIGER